MKKNIFTLLLLVFTSFQIFSLNLLKPGEPKDVTSLLPLDVGDYASWVCFDRNEDGFIDYAVQYGKKDQILAEALDFNSDGRMDDFYFYSDGTLIRREVDSNYDGRIDLWVYLREGVYIAAYERDSNYDGILDTVKQYGTY